MNLLQRFCIGLLAITALLFSCVHAQASEILLKMNEKNWKVNPETLGWIREYEKQSWGSLEIALPASLSVSLKGAPVPSSIDIKTVAGIDQGAATDYLRKKIAPQIERAQQDVVIGQDKNGKTVFDGFGLEGRMIDFPKAVHLLRAALKEQPDEAHLPIIRIPPKVEVRSEALRNQGIRELLATGETNFKGSPDNRINNINVGLNRFSGVLIPPQAEFVLGKTLGRVDESTGYKKELVIKGDQTIPEFGGGLCQVSTTIYRGALFSGLRITQRKNHSYAVSYYNPQGLDATVYPPTVDLKFINDTPSAILLETMTNKKGEAYVNYYGTKDDRKVTLLGPRYYKYVDIPPPRTEYTEQLAPGEEKKLGEAHQGFQASWFRQVDYGDPEKQPLKEHIYSKYEPRPLYYLIGKEPEKSEEKLPLTH